MHHGKKNHCKSSLFSRVYFHTNLKIISIFLKQIISSSSIIKYFIILRTSVLSIDCHVNWTQVTYFLLSNYSKPSQTFCKALQYGRCPIGSSCLLLHNLMWAYLNRWKILHNSTLSNRHMHTQAIHLWRNSVKVLYLTLSHGMLLKTSEETQCSQSVTPNPNIRGVFVCHIY